MTSEMRWPRKAIVWPEESQKLGHKRKSRHRISHELSAKPASKLISPPRENAHNSIPQREYEVRNERNRARGRPWARWRDNITESLHEHSMIVTETTRNARKRTVCLPRHMEWNGKIGIQYKYIHTCLKVIMFAGRTLLHECVCLIKRFVFFNFPKNDK